jgi:flap endonuclease-1
MGIKYLNKFLKEEAKDSIKFMSISEISGKKIVVDISIYIYKYAAEDSLIENIYLMLSVFRHYNITPIFIFDGKPPTEKKELLQKRRTDKKEAEKEYNKLKSQIANNVMDEVEKQDIINNMDMLKKKFVCIHKYDIDNVKKLIRAYGATYYDAPGEADEICALLVLKNKVWACLSEDMDMFVYGCTRVLRYFSLINHTAVLYYMKGILGELNMTHKEFKEICILSGTDYNFSANGDTSNINLHQTLKIFNKYKKSNGSSEFYNWALQCNYITDIDLLNKINTMFDLTVEHCNLETFKKIKIINGPIRLNDIQLIMKTEGFIFIE